MFTFEKGINTIYKPFNFLADEQILIFKEFIPFVSQISICSLISR
jgi:hypothetical protein